MKTVFLIGVLLELMCTAAIAAAADIQIAIALPQNRHGERALQYSVRNERFHVILTNSSETPKRIWQEWCSWGYYAMSFELTDESGKTWTVKKKPREWDKNYPDYWTLGPHESLVLAVEFADAEIWEGFPRPSGISRTFTMRAVFEIQPDQDSKQHAVWTGRAVSKADKYVFYK